MSTASLIVSAARSWAGTRFHHQGRLKKTHIHKGGVDCLGLLTGVARELGLKDKEGRFLHEHDELAYGHIPNGARLHARLAELLEDIPSSSRKAGDIVLFTIDGNPQHLGIVSDLGGKYGLIHAYAPARAVVETRLDAAWEARIVAAFRVAL